MKIYQLIAVALLLQLPPALATADQSDGRLDELFEVLRSSADPSQLQQTESEIWTIWHQSGSDEIDGWMQQAAALERDGDLPAAEALYTRVVVARPEFSEGWNRRATVRYYLRNYKGSLADIEMTLRLEPRHFGAIWGMGMIFAGQRDYARAIEAFQRLLEIKPNSPDARPRIELLKRELAKQAV